MDGCEKFIGKPFYENSYLTTKKVWLSSQKCFLADFSN